MKSEPKTSTREKLMDECSICGKMVSAFSEGNLKYNMKLHTESCKRKQKARKLHEKERLMKAKAKAKKQK